MNFPGIFFLLFTIVTSNLCLATVPENNELELDLGLPDSADSSGLENVSPNMGLHSDLTSNEPGGDIPDLHNTDETDKADIGDFDTEKYLEGETNLSFQDLADSVELKEASSVDNPTDLDDNGIFGASFDTTSVDFGDGISVENNFGIDDKNLLGSDEFPAATYSNQLSDNRDELPTDSFEPLLEDRKSEVPEINTRETTIESKMAGYDGYDDSQYEDPTGRSATLPSPPEQTTTSATGGGGGGDGTGNGFPNTSTTPPTTGTTTGSTSVGGGSGSGSGGSNGSGGGNNGGSSGGSSSGGGSGSGGSSGGGGSSDGGSNGGGGNNGGGSTGNNGNTSGGEVSGGGQNQVGGSPNNAGVIGGSIAGALIGAGALTGGLSWFFINKKKEEERKKRLRLIRQRRARLAALRGTSSESAVTLGESDVQLVRISRSGGNEGGAQNIGSASIVTIEDSASSPNGILDSSACSLPMLDIHTGNNGNFGQNIEDSGQNQGDPCNNTGKKGKLNLSIEESRF
ncbi:signal peptide-containing protein [Cryptosporidium canis]|uniref:Signal peptide-containing protein n=1 Tax=Cryptosporidium canis TaxID=195482 RepID=A0A9D5HW27_9CRYT|nr:signal peptide-containing protein [Cryptosporidium canis]